MQFIKVLATDSTNSALRRLYRKNADRENTCFQAENQEGGRGQRGSSWQSQAGQNLTFSLLINDLGLPVSEQFKISMLTSLAIVEVLDKFNVPGVSIKWPNDILSQNRKLAGILIENVLSGSQIKASVIGIGLNVNQEKFDTGTTAGSLKLLTGEEFNRDKLLEELTARVESLLLKNINAPFNAIAERYYTRLFKFQETADFILPEGTKRRGQIKSITNQGELVIDFFGETRTFDLKEVKMNY